MNTPERKPVRLRPVFWIVLLAATSIVVLWAWPEMQRQQRYLRTAMVLGIAGILLFFWMLFFSRLRWSIRFGGLVAVVAVLLGARYTLEIRGVNGDLLPIIEPRWKARSTLADTLPTLSSNQPALGTNGVSQRPDFPQFYGPSRNAVVSGPDLETDWGAHPPKILWQHPVGAGWSGFALKETYAVTLEQRGESEYVICYDLLSGAPVWTHANEAKYSTTIAGEGPRTTPTISSNRVYTFGGTGILNCLDLTTGKLLWTNDTARENDAKVPEWGFAGSPLLLDGQILVSVGGGPERQVVSYSAEDGKLLWAQGRGGADYSSPVEGVIGGERQIIVFAGSITGRDVAGKALWQYPWPGGHPHVTPPLVIDTNLLLITSGYGTGAELVKVEKTEGQWKADRVWKSMALKSKFGPIFHIGDYIYGLDDGIFCCVDLKTGQREWKDGRYGHGQGLLVKNLLLITTEKGEVVLIQPIPEKLVELARFKVFNDKTWNPPALAGEYLLMRNDKEAACLQLPLKKGLEKI